MLWDVDVSSGNGMYKSVLGPVGHIHVQSQLWWADVVDRRKVYWTALKAGGKLDQDTIADLNYVYRVSNPLAALHPVPRSLTPGFDSRPWTICSSYKLEKPHAPFLAVVWGLQTWRSTECHCTLDLPDGENGKEVCHMELKSLWGTFLATWWGCESCSRVINNDWYQAWGG